MCFNLRTRVRCDPSPLWLNSCFPRFNPRTHERCDVERLFRTITAPVSIRTPAKGAIRNACNNGIFVPFQSAHPRRVRFDLVDTIQIFRSVSIRAPTKGAMATHSKMYPIRVPSHPLSQQNRHNLGNPFPLTHPYVRPLREKTSRFYDHLRFALELSFGISHNYLCRGCKFSVATAKRPSFGLPRHPTKRRIRPC